MSSTYAFFSKTNINSDSTLINLEKELSNINESLSEIDKEKKLINAELEANRVKILAEISEHKLLMDEYKHLQSEKTHLTGQVKKLRLQTELSKDDKKLEEKKKLELAKMKEEKRFYFGIFKEYGICQIKILNFANEYFKDPENFKQSKTELRNKFWEVLDSPNNLNEEQNKKLSLALDKLIAICIYDPVRLINSTPIFKQKIEQNNKVVKAPYTLRKAAYKLHFKLLNKFEKTTKLKNLTKNKKELKLQIKQTKQAVNSLRTKLKILESQIAYEESFRMILKDKEEAIEKTLKAFQRQQKALVEKLEKLRTPTAAPAFVATAK